MAISCLRAMECIRRHQHIHTHYARRAEVPVAIAYAESEGWMPTLGGRTYGFDEVPELARVFSAGDAGFFPVYAVNPV